MKTQTGVLIGAGVLAVGGAAAFFLSSDKQKEELKAMINKPANMDFSWLGTIFSEAGSVAKESINLVKEQSSNMFAAGVEAGQNLAANTKETVSNLIPDIPNLTNLIPEIPTVGGWWENFKVKSVDVFKDVLKFPFVTAWKAGGGLGEKTGNWVLDGIKKIGDAGEQFGRNVAIKTGAGNLSSSKVISRTKGIIDAVGKITGNGIKSIADSPIKKSSGAVGNLWNIIPNPVEMVKAAVVRPTRNRIVARPKGSSSKSTWRASDISAYRAKYGSTPA